MNNRTIFGVPLRLRTVMYHWQESMKCIFHDTEKSPWSANAHKAIFHKAPSVSFKVAWIGFKNTPTERKISNGHDDVIKLDIFRVTGPLYGQFTGHHIRIIWSAKSHNIFGQHMIWWHWERRSKTLLVDLHQYHPCVNPTDADFDLYEIWVWKTQLFTSQGRHVNV